MYAIGIDSGTQSTKALVVDAATGRVLGRGQAPHAMVPGLKPGHSEQDPSTWVEALKTALAAALKEAAIDPARVAALGVSGQQHGFVPLGADGAPLRPAKLWNDTSTVAENEDLIAALGGPAACLEKLGLVPAVGFTASKILWLKRHEPDRFARLATVLLPHDYLNFVMTGQAVMEYGDASGTALLDVRKRAWSAEAAAAVDPGLTGKLPRLNDPGAPAGRMRSDFAAAFGFKDVTVAAGGGDNMMGAIGTGNVAPGLCTVSLGTSGTIYSFFDRPFFDPKGEIAAFCDSTGGWLPLLCTMNVTNATELWKGLLGIDSDRRDALAAQAPAGSDGLLFLPFVDGERVPPLPEASAAFFGLNRANFAAAPMTRAVMEGTILNLGYGFGRLRELGLRPSRIRATGGGAKSPFWRGLTADILGAPVETLAEPEAAALGASLQAVWCRAVERGEKVSVADLAAAWVKTSGPTVDPNPAHAAVYAERQERYNRLWATLRPMFAARG